MTATIDPHSHVMTLINVFSVTPENQQKLVDLLDEATEKAMRHQPGFISANIHKSIDGQKVVNYAQWRSKEDFDAMQKNPQARDHMGKAAALATFEPIVCEVASSFETSPPVYQVTTPPPAF